MADFLKKKNVMRVITILKKFNPNIKIIELETTANTAYDAAKSLNKDVGSIIKSLLFRSENNDFYLCLVSGDKFLSIEKFSKILNKKIFKANADEVKNQTGFSIGGVSPVAHLIEPNLIYIDINLNRFDKIYGAAGHPFVIFEIDFNNLVKITNAKIVNITE